MVQINPNVDNHLLSGNSINTGEGVISVIREDNSSINLYRYSAEDTAALAAYCTLEGGVYTKVATFPIDQAIEVGSVVRKADDSGNYGEVYAVLSANNSYTEFISQNLPTHIFVQSASLEPAQLDEIAKLTNMGASKIIASLYEKECEQYATLTLESGSSKLDTENPNTIIVNWKDVAMRRKVKTFSYTVAMYNGDGTESDLPKVTTSNWTKDGCIATVPASFTEGYAKVKITFIWNTDDETYRVALFINLTNWSDPVICVDTLEMYDIAQATGMLCSPAMEDPENFANCHDLTDEQMANASAIEIMVKKNWIKASIAKISYLINFGYTEEEATVLAKRFMTLSEAKAVTTLPNSAFAESVGTDVDGNSVSYNSSVSVIADTSAIDYTTDYVVNLTHFESFGYFCKIATISQSCFENCYQLDNVFLPLSVVTINKMAFRNAKILKNIQSLED